MNKKIFLVVLFLCLLVAGGVTAYFYLGYSETPDYSSGMFVDRGETDGYATMYNLLTSL